MGWLHAVNSGKGVYLNNVIGQVKGYKSFEEEFDFSTFSLSEDTLKNFY